MKVTVTGMDGVADVVETGQDSVVMIAYKDGKPDGTVRSIAYGRPEVCCGLVGFALQMIREKYGDEALEEAVRMGRERTEPFRDISAQFVQ